MNEAARLFVADQLIFDLVMIKKIEAPTQLIVGVVKGCARAVIRCLVAMSFGQNAHADLDWLNLALSPTFSDMADYRCVQALVADANGVFGQEEDDRNVAFREQIRADSRLSVAAAEDMLAITADVGKEDGTDDDGGEG